MTELKLRIISYIVFTTICKDILFQNNHSCQGVISFILLLQLITLTSLIIQGWWFLILISNISFFLMQILTSVRSTAHVTRTCSVWTQWDRIRAVVAKDTAQNKTNWSVSVIIKRFSLCERKKAKLSRKVSTGEGLFRSLFLYNWLCCRG